MSLKRPNSWNRYRLAPLMLFFSALCILLGHFAVDVAAKEPVGRPNADKGPTEVQAKIFVLDIDEINEVGQYFDANIFYEFTWEDPRLAHDGTGEVAYSIAEVWTPRVQLVNQQRVWKSFPDIVEVSPSGEVSLRQRIWGSFSQPLDLREYPFDQQSLNIMIVSAGYQDDEVILVPDPSSGLADVLSVPDYEVLSRSVETGIFEPSPGEASVPFIAFTATVERRIGYFVVKVILPLVLILGMSWVVFWIDPTESGTQISVAITTMLTLIAYRFAVGANLPKVEYLTRLDSFILFSTILVYASLIQVIITTSLARSGKIERARSIDYWSRWYFPIIFAAIALDTLVLRRFL